MIYPEDFEQKLGFDQIRNMLRSHCLCPLGQGRVDAILFSNDRLEIERGLKQNSEMVGVLQKEDAFPFSHYFDPTDLLTTIRPAGSFLEEDSFHQILLSLQSIFGARQILIKSKDLYPNLALVAEEVLLPVNVLRELQSKFNEEGKLKDDASPELSRIRKRLREEQSRIRRMVDQIFRNASAQGWVPDGISPTVREGRIVIPLLAEHKRKLKGFIVDESATGQTVYLEPADALEANNDLRDLELADRKEVVRILQSLTGLLRDHTDLLIIAYDFLGLLDYNRAKAKLSVQINAILPQIASEPALRWTDARHPLLFLNLRRAGREIVPLNISLDTQEKFLLISGPNAGGKSVCLKTAGLLQYMFQCGLLVSMHEQSTMGIFESMFIDIGDQQSIENDLSTYSSHLRNMAYFISHAGSNSFVLMDELGSGTDPNFGGGIAQAVLSRLLKNKVWGISTTHYYNLKLFAENTVGIVNGAMLFDAQKMEPLFILEVGRPGSSFALEIAKKTGLPADLISDAESIIGSDLAGLETLMKEVADEKIRNTQKTSELNRRGRELELKVTQYEKLSTELEARKKEILNKARDEASGLLKETNREIEKTIRHIRENKAEQKETRKVRQNLKELHAKVSDATPPVQSEKIALKVSDKVRLRGQEVTGTLLQISGSTAIVQFGDLRSSVKLDRLVRSDLIEPASVTKARSLGLDMLSRQSKFESTLDIRGKRVEEVIPELTQFIDNAILLGQGEVKILHGKGEGVLRKVVREFLKKTRAVASFADEHIERGGDGITVVVLK